MSVGTEQDSTAGTVTYRVDEQVGNDLSQRSRVGPHGQAGGHSRFKTDVPCDCISVVSPHGRVEFDFQIEMPGGKRHRLGDRPVNRWGRQSPGPD